MNKKFSILILFDVIEDVKETIKNLTKDICFSKTQIILLDNDAQEVKDEEIEKILNKYPEIIYIDVKDKNKSQAYNIGIKYATGEYISFIEQGVTYEKNAINSVKRCIENKDAKIVCLKPFFKQENVIKPYVMSTRKKRVDLSFYPLKLNLALESYFINRRLVRNFDENMFWEDAKLKFILETLMKYPFYYTVAEKKVYYTIPKENDTSTNFMQYNKEWYNTSLTDFVIPFLKNVSNINGEVPAYIQEAMLYYIFSKYNCNLKDRNKMVLSSEEAKEFFDNTAIALQYIDTNLILKLCSGSLFKIPRWLSYQFLLIKNKKLGINTDIKIEDEKIYLYEDNDEEKKYLLNLRVDEHVNIYAINYTGKTLEIDFNISVQDILERDNVSAFIKYNNQVIEAEKRNCYPLLKVFGLTVAKQIPFHVSIQLEEENQKIEFYYRYDGSECKLQTKFEKVQAHLNNSKYSYWNFNKKYCLCNKKEYLAIERKNMFSSFIKEIEYFFARMFRTNYPGFTFKYFLLRFAYRCVKPFYKNKQVWITFDKLYKAGDNGEYIYRYIKENHPEIKIYYAIKKESLDYERLEKEKNSHILVYGTFKHKLMSLLSTAILDTHANAVSYCSFDTKKARNCICDLFNPEIICIQHGLSIQKIAQYQNRWFDNIKLYCCASKYEVKNLLNNSMYDFKPEQITLTGLARYDGLKSNEQRQILITPTWRRNIVNSNVAHVKKTHNNFFKKSKYYEIYNNLINDKRLIETAEKNNYKIIYLLHPAISAQKADFEKNDYVEIIAATDNMNYEKILTESSLMVTDYSGVQFDFAYMRKPIVYYHPDELPPHYDAGGLDYPTMGFGPICKTNEEIVTTLCDYMEKNCVTEEEYIKRANDFFEYDDHNNCERIYNTIKKYMEERK